MKRITVIAAAALALWTAAGVQARPFDAIQKEGTLRLATEGYYAPFAHFEGKQLTGFAAFFGLGLEVRHVTLSAGQIGAAMAALGWEVLHSNIFWWAVALLPVNGALNVTVSFYLAFRVALRAHNVSGVDRSRIYSAIRRRLRAAPLSFFRP
jgi:hypothetical protein